MGGLGIVDSSLVLSGPPHAIDEGHNYSALEGCFFETVAGCIWPQCCIFLP